MRYTDIAIIGGGLAGSTAAAMLGRAGISTVLIDPHESYPTDFRVEKLSGQEQVGRFLKTGIAESVLRRATFTGENWIARFGRLLDKAPSRQFNILYDSLVNAVRDEIPASVERICAKAIAVETSEERQRVVLSNDETISARLVVLANGLNVGLRHQLGIARKVISACHSISIGFDIVPVGRSAFAFPALTYFSERPSDRIPYITLFPVGTRMRANLFVYRACDDPWLRELRPDRDAGCGPAPARGRHRPVRDPGRDQDPPGRSLRERLPRPARPRAGGRCLRDLLPGRRHRLRQGLHRRRAALQRPHPGLARLRRDECGQDRCLLRRSGQAGL